MELKQRQGGGVAIASVGFNRTFMELKHQNAYQSQMHELL